MTLVELLVVLGVIGLLVGLSVPALAGYARQARLKAATRQIVGLVTLARSMAISAHAEHAVVVDEERAEVRVVNAASGQALERVVHLPSNVTMALEVGGHPATGSQLVFRPTGSLTGRTTSIVISDGKKQSVVRVIGTTGAITVQ